MAQPPRQEERAWALFVELRKETIESQKIRAQIIGFKITFISSAVGLILANSSRVPQKLLIVPALAAVFFDFLIQSYSFSIKRIGRYCREALDPVLFGTSGIKSWEEFMRDPENTQKYSTVGNLGITTLAAVPAVMAVTAPFRWLSSLPLLLVFGFLLAVDSGFFIMVARYGGMQRRGINEAPRAKRARISSE